MTERATGARGRRLAGRGCSPARARARVLAQVRGASPASRRALPVGFADTDGAAGQLRRLDPADRSRPGARAPAGYARAFPGELRTLSGPAAACCSPSRPRPTCTPSPATRSRIGPRRRPRRQRAGRRRRRPARRRLAVPAGRRAGRARSRRRRRTTWCCCRAAPSNRASRGVTADRTQVHAASRTRCPAARARRSRRCQGDARNLETRLAGAGLVGDNLGTALDKARQDALYAQLLFLFLGVPGAVLAGLVTAVDRLRGRRPPPPRRRAAAHARRLDRRLVRLALAEAALAGGAGVALGLVAALAIGAAAFGTASFGAGTPSPRCCGPAAPRSPGSPSRPRRSSLPAWRDARALTVAGQRRAARPARSAPRGGRATASTSSRWSAAGAGLLAGVAQRLPARARAGGRAAGVGQLVRAARACARVGRRRAARATGSPSWCSPRPRRPLTRALRPARGRARRPTVAATMGRQRRLLARAVALVALTAAFAGSTAVFNSTYQQQAEVDARLTNGADVTVTESPRRGRRPGAPRPAGEGARGAQRRAAPAPLRLRRRRPAGPLRRPPAHDRRGRQAAGRLVRGRQRQAG